MSDEKIILEHGSGGEFTSRLIESVFLSEFSENENGQQTDSAVLDINGGLLSYTTDSYVIKPVFFPGGDIGKLSICGTVNDLAVSGCTPCYISVSFILEEGFPVDDLKTIVRSQAETARKAGVQIVCGDTKVVEKGACDGIFINTSGIGTLHERFKGISTGSGVEPGDAVIVSGNVGHHGTAVLAAREDLPFHSDIVSDCAPLGGMIRSLLDEVPDIVFMRDATRGGLATVLAEFAEMTGRGILVEEEKIPLDVQVKGLTDILGLDPFYLANEGTIVVIAKKGTEQKVLSVLKKTDYGKNSTVIGNITSDHPGTALIRTRVGGTRALFRLSGQQLPRIC